MSDEYGEERPRDSGMQRYNITDDEALLALLELPHPDNCDIWDLLGIIAGQNRKNVIET